MKIDNLLRIINGMLQNIPSVDHIESIKTDPLHVKSRDLFLDIKNSIENQKQAIKNGAYAIVSEKIEDIFDREIAWIEVDSMRLACVKLSRYELIKKSCKILYVDSIELDILQSITKNREYKELSSNAFEAIVILNRSGENIKFICPDKRLAFSIDPSCDTLKNSYQTNILKNQSPFYSSFEINEIFYDMVKIPSIFVEKLSKVIKYLDTHNIEYSLNNLSLKRHYCAVFVDYKLNKKEYGQSSRVVIFEENMDHISTELRYLSSFSNDIIVSIPHKFHRYFKQYKDIHLYKNQQELEKILKNQNFKFALILAKYKEYANLFSNRELKQLSLF